MGSAIFIQKIIIPDSFWPKEQPFFYTNNIFFGTNYQLIRIESQFNWQLDNFFSSI